MGNRRPDREVRALVFPEWTKDRGSSLRFRCRSAA